ncbi:MAG TPA: NAD(P)-dependent oxidoreductase [Acidimicrobiia bacterium]|nr:NAD(P)-dependent oxidoreductase [Acidimicrobiia bacterium]
MTTIGFFGLGRMGRPIASHLVAAGHRVLGVDPSPSARAAAESAGIEIVEDGSGVEASVVLTSLPNTPEVEEVYLGGLLDRLENGSLCLDLSTIDVDASRSIGEAARGLGHDFLDCPLSGTSVHAVSGTLAVMVGGEAPALERARPYLDLFSSAVHHVGPNGAGLEMKLITNRLLTAHLVAIAEAILEMEQAGLETEACIELLRQGAVPRLLDYKAIPMSRRDHTPLFTVDLMSKDLDLAEARRPPGSVIAAAAAVMAEARQRGWGPSDISAVIEVLTDSG